MSGTGHVRAEGDRSVAVGGDVREGAVIVTGDRNVVLQVDGENAILVERLVQPQLPTRERRPAPLDRRPPRSPRHVGREAETGAVAAGIQAGEPIELHGAAEIGKTYVLADALSRHDPAFLPDGVVYLFAKGKALRDLLQELLETFYDCRPRYVAGEPELRDALRDLRALLVLDSLEIERDELQQLVMAAPGCRFVLASRTRVLWEGTAIGVQGLPVPDALAVLEQELGRALTEDERPAARRVCETLGGHPLKLRQAGAQVREGTAGFDDLARSPSAEPALRQAMLDALPAGDRRIVDLLGSLGGAATGVVPLAALVGDPAVGARLEELERRGYVASASPRYRTAGVLAELPGRPDAGAVEHFAGWAAHGQPAEAVAAEEEALRALLRDAEPREVIVLAQAAANAFARTRRWGTWGDVLEAALKAAREVDDPRAVAWALHQIGTRAFCLGDTGGALRMLQTALALREDIGDEPGAEASRHNLEFIGGGGGPDRDDERPDGDEPPPSPDRWRWLLAGTGAALLVAGAVAVVTLAGDEDDQRPQRSQVETAPATVTPEPRPAPEIRIDLPKAGESYTAGSRVEAKYSCTDALECVGDVPLGAPVDTTSPGPKRFTVEATGSGGKTTKKSVTYTVAREIPDRVAPVVAINQPKEQDYAVGTGIPVEFTCIDGPTNDDSDDPPVPVLPCEGTLRKTDDATFPTRKVSSDAPLTGLSTGTYEIVVEAKDPAGNPAVPARVVFDVVNPILKTEDGAESKQESPRTETAGPR